MSLFEWIPAGVGPHQGLVHHTADVNSPFGPGNTDLGGYNTDAVQNRDEPKEDPVSEDPASSATLDSYRVQASRRTADVGSPDYNDGFDVGVHWKVGDPFPPQGSPDFEYGLGAGVGHNPDPAVRDAFEQKYQGIEPYQNVVKAEGPASIAPWDYFDKKKNQGQNRARAASKESAMTREAQILAAMAKASYSEQKRLARELEAIRYHARSRVEAARELDLTSRIATSRLTPAPVHELHTAATDWLGDLTFTAADRDEGAEYRCEQCGAEFYSPEDVEVHFEETGHDRELLEDDDSKKESSLSHRMAAEASLWFGRVSKAVKADREEFAEQAKGKARNLASAYGPNANLAYQAFIDRVAHLYRVAGVDSNQKAHDDNKDTEDDNKSTPPDWEKSARRLARLRRFAEGQDDTAQAEGTADLSAKPEMGDQSLNWSDPDTLTADTQKPATDADSGGNQASDLVRENDSAHPDPPGNTDKVSFRTLAGYPGFRRTADDAGTTDTDPSSQTGPDDVVKVTQDDPDSDRAQNVKSNDSSVDGGQGNAGQPSPPEEITSSTPSSTARRRRLFARLHRIAGEFNPTDLEKHFSEEHRSGGPTGFGSVGIQPDLAHAFEHAEGNADHDHGDEDLLRAAFRRAAGDDKSVVADEAAPQTAAPANDASVDNNPEAHSNNDDSSGEPGSAGKTGARRRVQRQYWANLGDKADTQLQNDNERQLANDHSVDSNDEVYSNNQDSPAEGSAKSSRLIDSFVLPTTKWGALQQRRAEMNVTKVEDDTHDGGDEAKRTADDVEFDYGDQFKNERSDWDSDGGVTTSDDDGASNVVSGGDVSTKESMWMNPSDRLGAVQRAAAGYLSRLRYQADDLSPPPVDSNSDAHSNNADSENRDRSEPTQNLPGPDGRGPDMDIQARRRQAGSQGKAPDPYPHSEDYVLTDDQKDEAHHQSGEAQSAGGGRSPSAHPEVFPSLVDTPPTSDADSNRNPVIQDNKGGDNGKTNSGYDEDVKTGRRVRAADSPGVDHSDVRGHMQDVHNFTVSGEPGSSALMKAHNDDHRIYGDELDHSHPSADPNSIQSTSLAGLPWDTAPYARLANRRYADYTDSSDSNSVYPDDVPEGRGTQSAPMSTPHDNGEQVSSESRFRRRAGDMIDILDMNKSPDSLKTYACPNCGKQTKTSNEDLDACPYCGKDDLMRVRTASKTAIDHPTTPWSDKAKTDDPFVRDYPDAPFGDLDTSPFIATDEWDDVPEGAADVADVPVPDGMKNKRGGSRIREEAQHYYAFEDNYKGPEQHDQAGFADSSDRVGISPEEAPSTMFPYQDDHDKGENAADVADTPTPGQSVADYPQPKSSRRVEADAFTMTDDQIHWIPIFTDGDDTGRRGGPAPFNAADPFGAYHNPAHPADVPDRENIDQHRPDNDPNKAVEDITASDVLDRQTASRRDDPLRQAAFRNRIRSRS